MHLLPVHSSDVSARFAMTTPFPTMMTRAKHRHEAPISSFDRIPMCGADAGAECVVS